MDSTDARPPADGPQRDRPWVMRTYAGHSSARASNELYRRNLAKGQTGLSVAFDLPTQTGYDPDRPVGARRGRQGRRPDLAFGRHAGLFREIPLDQMNTSMTINATAMWLLALYIATAEEQGVDAKRASGHHPERHHQGVPVARHVRVPACAFVSSDHRHGGLHRHQRSQVEPDQHLQLSPARSRRDNRSGDRLCHEHGNCRAGRRARLRAKYRKRSSAKSVQRISFFVNAGVRFIEEMCKMRAFVELWDELTEHRYGVIDPKQRRFRYGVQVNSLGLTEAQPENNIARIMLEMLGVTLSKDARGRAIQLPAWNEAFGLPRPWDQQWSLRMQQVLAFESDLFEYADLFDGSAVVEAKVAELVTGARAARCGAIEEHGRRCAAVESGYMKTAATLMSHAERRRTHRDRRSSSSLG